MDLLTRMQPNAMQQGQPMQTASMPPVQPNFSPMQNYWQGNKFVAPGFLGGQPNQGAPDLQQLLQHLAMMQQQQQPRQMPQPQDLLQQIQGMPL